MTKQELEKKVLDLEAKLAELQNQMLTLALRPIGFVSVPEHVPLPNPLNPWPSPFSESRITCSSSSDMQKDRQNFGFCG